MTADEALKEQYKQEAIGVGSQLAAGIGGQIGRAYAPQVACWCSFRGLYKPRLWRLSPLDGARLRPYKLPSKI
jgi:hypothetical protein